MPPERPSTAPDDSATLPLSKLIPQLVNAIDTEVNYYADRFQAVVCLGWIHWVLKDSATAAARLPHNVALALEEALESATQSPSWVQVCGVKAAYIKGRCDAYCYLWIRC